MQAITVVETDIYKAGAARLLTENEQEGIRGFVAGLPEAGDVIPGLDGLRKMRWTQQQRNKGKRGGTRIVYFWATLDQIIVLLSCVFER